MPKTEEGFEMKEKVFSNFIFWRDYSEERSIYYKADQSSYAATLK